MLVQCALNKAFDFPAVYLNKQAYQKAGGRFRRVGIMYMVLEIGSSGDFTRLLTGDVPLYDNVMTSRTKSQKLL